jgi:hypothetical protein
MLKMRSRKTTIWVIAIAAMLMLLGPLAGQSRGDFVLWDDQQITVNSHHNQGNLYDTSRAFIVPGGSVTDLFAEDFSAVGVSGGSVYFLYACDSSVVDVSGGSMSDLEAWNSSTVDISGGSVNYLCARDSTAVDISGGTVSWLDAHNSSIVNISGGSVSNLWACDFSAVILYGQNFRVGGGLVFDGERVLGLGTLSGEWMDGTPWTTNIAYNETTATIWAIPEPATLLLLGLGVPIISGLRKKR